MTISYEIVKYICKTHFLLFTEIPFISITGNTGPIHETEPLMMECELKRPIANVKFTWRFQPDVAGRARRGHRELAG